VNRSDFTYDNRTGRAPGPFLRALSALVPSVARVQDQVGPYALAWQAHNRQALAHGGRRWFVLGDSLSQGVGASLFESGWVGQLHDRIPSEARPHIINLSASGARVSDVLNQQIPVYRSLVAESRTPDLMTLLVGSNDLFGSRAHRRHLPVAFSALLDQVPIGAVVATLTQPAKAASLANVYIERTGASGAIQVVDLRTDGPSTWRGKLASDRFHPNDEGYAAIADAFEPAVRRALGLSSS